MNHEPADISLPAVVIGAVVGGLALFGLAVLVQVIWERL